MAEVNELINVKYDKALAENEVYLKSIFSEVILGYCRNLGLTTYEEIITIENINITKTDIGGTIKGLPHLVNLKTINLSINMLDSVGDLGGLTNLESVNLSVNNLKSIGSLLSSPNLRILNIANNQIENMRAIDRNLNLEELRMGNNNISSFLSLSNLSKLVILEANNIGMTSFDSSRLNFTKLEEIDLSDNSLNTTRVNDLLQGANTAKTSGKPLRILNLGGPNMGIPTGGDANADVVALRAAGVTVTIRTE